MIMKNVFYISMMCAFLWGCGNHGESDQGSSRHSGANADAERSLLSSPNNTDRVESGQTTHPGSIAPDSVRRDTARVRQ
jgi:hypothetical protein